MYFVYNSNYLELFRTNTSELKPSDEDPSERSKSGSWHTGLTLPIVISIVHDLL